MRMLRREAHHQGDAWVDDGPELTAQGMTEKGDADDR